jgi:thioesterase domain-containing protein
VPFDAVNPEDLRLERIARAYFRIIQQYVPGRYAGRLTLIASLEGRSRQAVDPTLGWGQVAAEVEIVKVPGNHLTCVTTHVEALAKKLQHCLDEARV